MLSLAEENEMLREEVRQLRATASLKVAPKWAHPLGLSKNRQKLLKLLQRNNVMTREMFFAALYGDRPDGGPDPKILDVMMCHLRRALKPYGIEIQNTYTVGWYLTKEAKRRLTELGA